MLVVAWLMLIAGVVPPEEAIGAVPVTLVTVPVAGLYECIFITAVQNNGYENDLLLYKNGSATNYAQFNTVTAGSQWVTLPFHALISCAAND